MFWADQTYKPKIDDFCCSPSRAVFRPGKEFITAPITQVLKMSGIDTSKQEDLDSFILKPKKCYHLDKHNGVKIHIIRYLNYFENYYDPEKELLAIYARMKASMDIIGVSTYNDEAFMLDLKRYILSDSMRAKVERLMNDCFEVELKRYPSQNMVLCYEERHVRLLMELTVFSNMMIPLIMHYAYKAKTLDVDGFTAACFQLVMKLHPDIDIHAKIQETVFTNVNRLSKNDELLWEKCAIRGIDKVINTMYTIDNIILNVMPKYNFNNNPINMNIATIKNDIKYKVVEVPYEYDVRNLNSSNREGEDNASPYDKFESQCIRTDEALMLQNIVNAEYTMKEIIDKWGQDISKAEMNYYIRTLTCNGKRQLQDSFQRSLVLNLFMKYFGDTASIKEIVASDYVRLMIIGKRLLKGKGLIFMAEIFGGFVERISNRTSISKRELEKLERLESFKLVRQKYMDQKTIGYVIEIIATILTSDFRIIDFYDSELDGVKIPNNKCDLVIDRIMDEACNFILMI
ncbi:MAG: hypothetical protein IJ889_00095 [Eubacterium sp.]|nr:hypothetical protein [Eubacterium sp.]MBR2247326.1 hypothetical protein [Bacilli bacterium]